MKQKKLVELFAVIVILALVATPIILNVINDAKKEAKDSTFTYENDTKKQEDKKLTQTKSETTEDTENYKFYENGTAIYYNPETGKKCESSEVETPSKTGTKSGCMKWYVFNDKKGNATVNVILDHNTTADTVIYGLTKNNKEMKEVADALKTDTSTWKNKARLITANEIAKITGNTRFDASKKNQDWFYLDSNNQTQTTDSSNKSKYAWLFDYTTRCIYWGCNEPVEDKTAGYWTSSSYKGSSSLVWFVGRYGYLKFVDYVGKGNGIGVRPVITISKSDI